MLNLIYLALGICLLAGGGELLIRGALGLARRLGISPLLSGLLIVGFGTSAPELAVSLDAVLNRQPNIAIGNIVGSNISNVLLVLGVCAMISPMAVQPLVLRRDAAMVVTTSALFLLLTASGVLQRGDGLVLLALLVVYLIWAYRSESRGSAPSAGLHAAEGKETGALSGSLPSLIAAALGGLVILLAGSRVLLTGAVGIAQGLGVSETVIGLTVVAVGTSLPELSISMLAAARGHAEVAVGNILGSNVFNLLCVLGVSSVISPLPLDPRIVQLDQWVMLVTAVLICGFLYTGRRLSRREGGVLLFAYAGYLFVGVGFGPA